MTTKKRIIQRILNRFGQRAPESGQKCCHSNLWGNRSWAKRLGYTIYEACWNRLRSHMWVFPKIGVYSPKSSILTGFSLIPSILGYPYFWKHSCIHMPNATADGYTATLHSQNWPNLQTSLQLCNLIDDPVSVNQYDNSLNNGSYRYHQLSCYQTWQIM